MKFKVLLALVMVGAAFAACSVYDNDQPDKIVSVSSEMAVSGPTVTELQTARANLHRVLIDERVTQAAQVPVTVQVTRQELLELAQQELNEREFFPGPKLVGMVKPVFAAVDLAPVQIEDLTDQARLLDVGAIRAAGDGFVHTTTVRSEGAQELRVHISDLSLPANVELYVFNADGEAHGPYAEMGPNDTGEFWTPSVKGSEMFIQVRHYGVATRADLLSTWFVIDEVGHIAEGGVAEYGLGTRCYGATCTQNASCGDGPLAGSEGAIAHYTFIKRPYVYMCSGGLLADSFPGDIPYFLTANHCLSKQRDANTAEFYFDFQTACGTTCGDNANALEVTGGATILSTNSTSDYTLMQINGTVPAGRVFLGWTNAGIAYNNGAGLFRLSHPNGGPLAYSEHVVDTSKGTCGSWPRGNWIYSMDTYGATEGGSSGSPVLNDAGQVVGQLSGGCGTNVSDDCDAVSNATVDGALAAYYNNVSSWLGAGEPECAVDGDCAGLICCGGQCVAPTCSADADCEDGEACTTDTCSLAGTCDANCGGSWAACGLADGCCGPTCDSSNDVDCPDCGAVGASCNSGADCCSGKCKGKPGSMVCR